jgi:hypothetical protein
VRIASIVSAVVVLAVLWPVRQNFRAEPVDDFPLSYFPMFTDLRNGRTTLTHPIGIRADGTAIDLHYKTVSSSGMNQVRRQINKRVREEGAEPLCEKVAERVRKSKDPALNGLVAVAIVEDRYEFETFFGGDPRPASRDVLAQIPIGD